MTDAADDVSADFQNRRILLAQASAADELLQRVGSAGRSAEPAAAPAAAPAGAGAVPATSPIQNPANQSAFAELITGRRPDSMPIRVLKDVGQGVIESPRAVVKGVRDAYQSTLDLGKDVGDYIEQKLSLPVLHVGSDGVYFSTNEKEKGHRLSDLAKLPDIAGPTSVTGGLVKGVAQFLTGLKGVNKLATATQIPQLTGAADYALSAVKGAIANFTAFDPHQQRLSNLIEQFPQLQNPVTEYLQSKPGDTEVEGRFKNAIEGAGLGVLTDTFFKGVKMLRDAAFARKGLEQAGEAIAPQAASEELGKLLQPVGDGGAPGEPPLIVKPRGDGAAEKLTAAAARTAQIAPDDIVGRMAAPLEPIASSAEGRAMDPQRTFINFAHVDTPEDVQKAMQRLADVVPLQPDAARSGVRSFADMKLDAAHQNAWDALASRAQGEPLSDAKMLAARQLWASSTDKLAQLAQEAATTPSEANLFAFRKMLATHNMIQNEVLGARASIARAQASMRIPVGSSAERLKQLSTSLEQAGGGDVARELAQAVSGMARSGMIEQMSAVAEKGAFARTVDAAKEAWTLGLLTSPKTHFRNILSNAAFAPLQIAERAAAGKFGELLGQTDGVVPGEAAAQYFGATQGVKDMFTYYSRMLRAKILGSPDDVAQAAAANPINETGLRAGDKLDLPPAISSEALKLDPENWLGKSADAVGSLYGLTSKALTAEDNFFKVLGYRMESYAQAFRQARNELGVTSADSLDEAGRTQLAARIADLVENPPENIRMASADQALYQTFNESPGWFGQMLLKAKRNSLVAHILIPFARTTANLQRAAFERTPLAPLVGQWRADIAAGGARQQLALARWSLGSAATLALIDHTLRGQVTGRGPVEPGKRQALAREGWRPYSWKVGDRWFQYNGISPIGDTIGMAADATEMAMHGNEQMVDGKDMEKVILAGTAAIAGNVMNKSYLSGLSSAIEALNDPTGSAAQWARQLAGSIVPSAVNAVTKAMDPKVRAVNSMMDAIRARIPGMSESLPTKPDLWGEPMRTDSGYGKAFDAFSPVFSQKPTPEPIDQEIIRQNFNIEMPQPQTSFDGATVDLRKYPAAYERYVILAGNELKNPAWKLGAKDLLNAIVEGKHPLSRVYAMRSDGPDGGKETMIRSILSDYREMARRQVLKEFPDLASEVSQRQARARALKMPQVQ